MAKSNCWKPECEFTGSKAVSDTTPGRCTKEGGYISNAEINEILLSGGGKKAFYDKSAESNILLYKGTNLLLRIRIPGTNRWQATISVT
jgi:hypothetical protein